MSEEVEYHATYLFPQFLFCRREPNANWTKPEFVKDCLSFDYRKNGSNWVTLNTYVLDLPEFKELKDIIQDQLNKVFKDQYKLDGDKVQIYITQSWLNVSDSDESHNQHRHPNSVLSGVVYIKTNEPDHITFIDNNFNTRLNFGAEGIPPYQHVPVQSGDMLIFDSQLAHMVNPEKRKDKRVSLAFNTFIKGTLGSYHGLDEVKING